MVGRGHPLYEHQDALSAQEVAQLEFALLTPDYITRTCIDEFFAKAQITPKVVIEVNSVNTLLEVIRHSTIATILPEPIATQDRALRKLSMQGTAPERGAALLRRKNNYHSAASVAFVDLVLGADFS
ncbi:HTH-type transcriptional regulator CynR [compost metagenome]